MKKTVLIPLLVAVAVSCGKKEIPADPLEENNLTVENTETTGHNHPETMPVAENTPITNAVLAQSHYDFGKIKKGEKVSHTYEITNTGEQPLIIAKVEPECGCTAPEFTKDPIMPGEKGNVVLSFDSSSFEGMINKSAKVFANVENAPINLSFSAQVQTQ